jgi:hypothetical protein
MKRKSLEAGSGAERLDTNLRMPLWSVLRHPMRATTEMKTGSPYSVSSSSLFFVTAVLAFAAMTSSAGPIEFPMRGDATLMRQTKAYPTALQVDASHRQATVLAQVFGRLLLH